MRSGAQYFLQLQLGLHENTRKPQKSMTHSHVILLTPLSLSTLHVPSYMGSWPYQNRHTRTCCHLPKFLHV